MEIQLHVGDWKSVVPEKVREAPVGEDFLLEIRILKQVGICPWVGAESV